MKIPIETYRLLRKMGTMRAWSTLEIVDITGKQRCAVLKRLHRLETAKIVEKRMGKDQKFYWKVCDMPEKPKAPKIWKESRSIYDIAAEKAQELKEANDDK
jgi:hypothetical protein